MIPVWLTEHARIRLAQRYGWLGPEAEPLIVVALQERRYRVVPAHGGLGKHRGLSDRDLSMEVLIVAQARRLRLRIVPKDGGLVVITALPERQRRYRPSAEERADLSQA